MISLQEKYAPKSICYGCGPANAKGLQIHSVLDPQAPQTTLLAKWKASPEHQAFPGVINGGIIGALLDCHSNWTAAIHLMREAVAKGEPETLPSTVTADFHVKLKRPTPVNEEISLKAWVVETSGPKVKVEAELSAGGKVCATCTGTFMAVEPGHPAYHRW